MREYEYVCVPRARRWTSFVASGLFFACSMSFAVMGTSSRIRELFLTTAFLTLVVSLLIAKRFITVSYSYAVFKDSDTGAADLVIFEHALGKKEPLSVCRVSLYDISLLEAYDRTRNGRKKARRAKEKRKGGRFYDYRTELFPREYCILRFSEREDDVYVKFTPDEKLKGIIKSAML